MATPALSPDDYRSLAEIRYQIRCFLHFSDRAARAAGIEPQRHQLLLACKGLPEGKRPTIGTLAERLCIQHHTAVALVDSLVAQGLVARVRAELDRREVLVEITAVGEALLRQLSALHREQLRSVAPALIEAVREITDEVSAPQFTQGARTHSAGRGGQ